ncbi:MAG: hypothetical protein U1E63_12680 [Burkholderiales bacterium]
MSDEDWEGLRQAIYVSGAMLAEDTGLLCIPATEMFFAFEAFSKAIASTRCGLFLEEVVKEDASVQQTPVHLELTLEKIRWSSPLRAVNL